MCLESLLLSMVALVNLLKDHTRWLSTTCPTNVERIWTEAEQRPRAPQSCFAVVYSGSRYLQANGVPPATPVARNSMARQMWVPSGTVVGYGRREMSRRHPDTTIPHLCINRAELDDDDLVLDLDEDEG
jgi:hypothetical protein